MWKRRFVLMDAAAGEGADAGGAGGGAAASGDGGAGGASLLAGGAAGAGDGAAVQHDFIPEKYRVSKEDGTFDIDASARKLAEAHGHLEKRFGSGDVPPKTADEYTVAVPDQFKDAWQADDPQFKEFAAKAHELGFNQQQFGFLMDKFFEIVPNVAAGAGELNAEAAGAALEKVWTDPTQRSAEIKAAYGAADRIAQSMGLTFDDLDKAGLGNNPMFIRVMAKLAPEFKEDSQVQNTLINGKSDIEELRRSEAYSNPKHPKHAETVAKVRAYYDSQPGGSAPVV